MNTVSFNGLGINGNYTKNRQSSFSQSLFSDTLKSAGKVNKDVYKVSGNGCTDKLPQLSHSDLRYIADNHNPMNMSQNQYNSFLDALVEKGVITDDEKMMIGYDGCYLAHEPGVYPIPDSENYFDTLESAGNNAWQFIHSMASTMEYWMDLGKGGESMKSVASIYSRIQAVMKQMMASS